MPNLRNSLFNISFKDKERRLSRMDKDEVMSFLEHIARVTYDGKFVCTAYWCPINDMLEVSNEDELTMHFKEVITDLMLNP